MTWIPQQFLKPLEINTLNAQSWIYQLGLEMFAFILRWSGLPQDGAEMQWLNSCEIRDN